MAVGGAGGASAHRPHHIFYQVVVQEAQELRGAARGREGRRGAISVRLRCLAACGTAEADLDPALLGAALG